MNPNDDPRLTAYVLDELSGDEREAFEAELDGDDALRGEVEALRALLGPVTEALRNEPVLETPQTTTSVAAPLASGFAWHRAAAAALAAATLWWAVDASSRRPRATDSGVVEVARVDGLASDADVHPLPLPPEASAPVGTDLVEAAARDETKRAHVELADNRLTLDRAQSRVSDRFGQALEQASKAAEGIRTEEDRLRELVSEGRGPHLVGGRAPSVVAPENRVVPIPVQPGQRAHTDAPLMLPPASPPSGPGTTVSVLEGPAVPRLKVEMVQVPASDPAIGIAGGAGSAFPSPQGATDGNVGSSERVLRVRVVDAESDLPTKIPATGNEFGHVVDPGWTSIDREHTSTFSLDVDTASLSIVRRMVREGRLPPADAVRIEELLNAFDYGYAPPLDGDAFPLRMHATVAACPWDDTHRLVRFGIKAREVEEAKRPPVHLVFLLDVSGSMKNDDRLPLAKHTLTLLLSRLRADDRIAIVTYANEARVALPSTSGSERETIQAAIDRLSASGGTNGAGGIQMAYEQARAFAAEEGAVRRVLLMTDGDFNIGVSDTDQLEALIAEQASTGVWLSVFGMGMGNVKDDRLERLSNRGNGTYAYLDTIAESQKVLVDGLVGTLIPVAKDAKVQVFFNPERVGAWRLLGYANRRLATADFSDDRKDAGDIGAGHEVTALYEIIPAGLGTPVEPDENPFVASPQPKDEEKRRADRGDDEEQPLLMWRMRAKEPTASESVLVEENLFDTGLGFAQADVDVQWAAGVAAFGAWLRREPAAVRFGADGALELLTPAAGEDAERKAFVDLAKRASTLAR